MHLDAIGRSASLVDEVFAQLSAELVGRRAKGGGWLPSERQLAQRLQVSRPVVREAIKRLELQGLIEVKHGIGTRVVNRLHTPLTGSLGLLLPDQHERLRQTLEARAALEPEVARLAAERMTQAALKELRRAHARLEAAQSVADAVEADLEFHHLLARGCGNQVFVLILDSLAELGKKSRFETISNAGVRRAIEHHAAILNAVVRHQPDSAATAMRHHMEAAVDDLQARQKSRKSR